MRNFCLVFNLNIRIQLLRKLPSTSRNCRAGVRKINVVGFFIYVIYNFTCHTCQVFFFYVYHFVQTK